MKSSRVAEMMTSSSRPNKSFPSQKKWEEEPSYFLSSLFDPSYFPSSLPVAFLDVVRCFVPIWLAVMIGLLIGWSWRPRWTTLLYLSLRSHLRFLLASVATAAPPSSLVRLHRPALSAFSAHRAIWSNLSKHKDVGLTESSKDREDEVSDRCGDFAPDYKIDSIEALHEMEPEWAPSRASPWPST